MKRFLTIFLLAFPLSLPAAEMNYDNLYNVRLVSDAFQARCFAQDEDGFIWIGTANGLCRFDGYSFQKIDSGTDTIPISNAFIENIYNDKAHNRLWIQTDRWFCCYDPDTEQFQRMKVNGTDRQWVSFLCTSSGESARLGTYRDSPGPSRSRRMRHRRAGAGRACRPGPSRGHRPH